MPSKQSANQRAPAEFRTGRKATLPKQVESKRLGVMGLSGGGALNLWMSLVDARIRATEIIGYSDLWADMGIRDTNYCGLQVAPGLCMLVDIPDLQGLLAPRPAGSRPPSGRPRLGQPQSRRLLSAPPDVTRAAAGHQIEENLCRQKR